MARALRKEQSNGAATDGDAAQTSAFLRALFGSICAPGGSAAGTSEAAASSWLREAEARCIGAYAAWFGDAPDQALLAGALQHLLHCMAAPSAAAADAAGAAFRNLCVRCGPLLVAGDALPSLIGAAKDALSQQPGAPDYCVFPQ